MKVCDNHAAAQRKALQQVHSPPSGRVMQPPVAKLGEAMARAMNAMFHCNSIGCLRVCLPSMVSEVKAKWQRSCCLCIAYPSPCCAVLMAGNWQAEWLLFMIGKLQKAGAPHAEARPHLKELVED